MDLSCNLNYRWCFYDDRILLDFRILCREAEVVVVVDKNVLHLLDGARSRLSFESVRIVTIDSDLLLFLFIDARFFVSTTSIAIGDGLGYGHAR